MTNLAYHIKRFHSDQIKDIQESSEKDTIETSKAKLVVVITRFYQAKAIFERIIYKVFSFINYCSSPSVQNP